MFKEQLDKIKSLMQKKIGEGKKEDKTNKKKVENLIFFLIVLIVTLIAINAILKQEETDTKEEQSPYKILADKEENKQNDSTELETKIGKILETMAGVRQS